MAKTSFVYPLISDIIFNELRLIRASLVSTPEKTAYSSETAPDTIAA